jgi:hypothetical protein
MTVGQFTQVGTVLNGTALTEPLLGIGQLLENLLISMLLLQAGAGVLGMVLMEQLPEEMAVPFLLFMKLPEISRT